MISITWTIMVVLSIFGGLLFSTAGRIGPAAMEGAASALELGISLAGPLCLWCGVGELMARSGLREKLSRALDPLLGRLFPELRHKPDGFSALCANVTANLLGLGNAATPMGIEACRAMADGSVPVGRYTRTALMNLGILPEVEDASVYTTAEVSDALGGVEISEQGNVSQVLTAVVEGSCEVDTIYYSDTYGYEDQIDVLETVSYDLTGNVIYPVCQVVNDEATDAQKAAAADFVSFITSDTAKAIFDSYYFDTNLQ